VFVFVYLFYIYILYTDVTNAQLILSIGFITFSDNSDCTLPLSGLIFILTMMPSHPASYHHHNNASIYFYNLEYRDAFS